MNQKKFKIYLCIFFSIFLSYYLVFIITITLVDPYNELGNNKIGIFFSTDRQAKSAISKYKHNAILIGSSRTLQIPPSQLNCYVFYNASFGEATVEEMFYYLEKYAIEEEFVLIGLDFYMFNEQWTFRNTLHDAIIQKNRQCHCSRKANFKRKAWMEKSTI